MKKMVVVAVLALGLVLMSMPAFALQLGAEITIYDGYTYGSDSWYGAQEDNEVEYYSVANQSWDLEGFFLDGTTLSMVGGWDFTDVDLHVAPDAYDRDNDGYYTSGDVFIDVNGDYNQTDGYYDYVFDVDWGAGSYSLYSLNNNSTYLTTTYVTSSNPWRYEAGGISRSSGTFTSSTLTSDEVAALGFAGYDDNNVHNVVSFDLLPILTDLGVSKIDFTSHFTMECGNDNLMGQGTAPVPEPQTLLLMGIGLLGLAFVGRKKLGERA